MSSTAPVGRFFKSLQVAVFTLSILTAASAEEFALESNPDLENVSGLNNVKLDFRYATPQNFLGRAVYGDFKQCYLHRIAAYKLKRAAKSLEKQRPGWKLLLFDCTRPRSIQKAMWAIVKGTPKQKYVANPDTGSMHNFGFAVDLSLVDETGTEIDMGTPFDYFGPESQPRKEKELLAQGRLTRQQIDNRMFLRSLMTDAGFLPLAIEWWHFDALDKTAVRKGYKIIE